MRFLDFKKASPLPCVFRVDVGRRGPGEVFAGKLGAPGTRKDLLTAPRGLAVARGLLYVADPPANRVVAFKETDGSYAGELAVDTFGALWAQSQEELLGDAVEVTENYRSWWSYVPHFIASPGYVYAYAYGQLLALAVYGRYEEEGPGFADAYLELLSAGGSKSPEELGAIVGVDLTDPGFWDKGLDIVERKLDAAEQAARDAGRV